MDGSIDTKQGKTPKKKFRAASQICQRWNKKNLTGSFKTAITSSVQSADLAVNRLIAPSRSASNGRSRPGGVERETY